MRGLRAKQLILIESLEARYLRSSSTYSLNGTGNNLANPDWGSVNQALLRVAPSAYTDGISTPAGSDRPSARVISNTLMAHHGDDIFSDTNLSDFAYAWGQFVDHDIDLTSDADPSVPFNIAVPTGDPYFDPTGTGDQTITLNRSETVPGTGVTTPLQQPNDLTAFLDGSVIYGTDPARLAAMRTFSGGQLKTSAGDLLPFNTGDFPNETGGGDPSTYFLSGDTQVNENAELTVISTLMMREHNRLAGIIASQNPGWNDEQIFQEARKLVTAEIQMITYNEYLPAILGQNAMPAYSGYNPAVNPQITQEFSTAAFRLGHSMLGNDVQFFDDDGNTTAPNLHLADIFFNPQILEDNGIDSLLKYLNANNSQEVGLKIEDGVRNFLFGAPGDGGLDLAALDIQRGRDHGLPDYNTERVALGLPRITSFSQISSDVLVQQELKAEYKSVNNIDLYVGGLAEDHLPGSSMGPTFQAIIVDQFTRIRAGDRLWYQNNLTPSEMAMIQGTTLTKVIEDNTSLRNMQANSFIFDVEVSGTIFTDSNKNGRMDPDEQPIAGQLVQLYDDDADDVAASTHTDAQGHYSFTQIQVGNYSVVPQLSPGYVITNPVQPAIAVTKGELFPGRNFGEIHGGLISTSPVLLNSNPTPQFTGIGSTPGFLTSLKSSNVSERVAAQVLSPVSSVSNTIAVGGDKLLD